MKMQRIDFPAPYSMFRNKDAILHRYKFWTELKGIITKQCFPLPVVYTDGLISYIVEDSQGRTPWGIALSDYLIPIKAPKEAMTKKEMDEYCKTIVFADRTATLLSMEVLRYIRRNRYAINTMLKSLNGTLFESDVYLSTDQRDNQWLGMSMGIGFGSFYFLDDDDKVLCRPAINILDAY